MKNDTATANASTSQTSSTERPARRGVFVQMSEQQHRDLKVRAAQEGDTLQNLVSTLLQDAIEGGTPPHRTSAPRRRGRNG